MGKIDSLIMDVEKLGLTCEAGPLANSMSWLMLRAEIRELQADANHWRRLLQNNNHPDDLLRRAKNVIHLAETTGMVVRIETRPLLPLAMGNYEMVASVQERRAPAVPYDRLGAALAPDYCAKAAEEIASRFTFQFDKRMLDDVAAIVRRHSFHSSPAQGDALSQQAADAAPWKPSEQQFKDWCERHDIPEHHGRDPFDDAASLYLAAKSQEVKS